VTQSSVIQEALTKKAAVRPKPAIDIRAFWPEDAKAFRVLNEDWIAKYFGLEEKDRITLGDPEGQILQKGGHIFMAFSGDGPVGCCALLLVRPGVYEVAKMTVAEEYRGYGIGRRVLAYTIEQARLLALSLCIWRPIRNLWMRFISMRLWVFVICHLSGLCHRLMLGPMSLWS